MNLSSEALALLASVRDNHADDTPRLIFADYLDERGTPEAAARAEFIRCQIELVRFESFEPAHRKEFNELARANLEKRMSRLERGDSESIKIAKAIEEGGRLYRQRHEWLLSREQELLGQDYPPILGVRSRNIDGRWQNNPYGWIGVGGYAMDWCWFHRGFLSRIRCDWNSCSQHLDSILADPWVPGLDEVELTTQTDLEPFDSDMLLWWFPGLPRDHRINREFGAFYIDENPENLTIIELVLRKAWPQVRSWKLPPEPRTDEWRPQRAPQRWQNDWPADYEGHDLINPGGRDER